jgi:hypothetical protein
MVDIDRALLEAMLTVPGALKFVTPHLREDAPDDADLKDMRTFVWEDVVAIEDHPGKGHLVLATTAEGSTIVATPATMLQKLQEWRTAEE